MSALSERDKRRIRDRFIRDAEAVLDPTNISDIGNLWSQILDARQEHSSVPLRFTANATALSHVLAMPKVRKRVITKVTVSTPTAFASAAGTITFVLERRKGVAAAVQIAPATGTTDLEGLVVDQASDLTLAKLSDRTVLEDEVVYARVVSNNADATGGAGAIVMVESEPAT